LGRGFWFSRGTVSQIGARGSDRRSALLRTLRKLRHSCSKSRRSCISSGEVELCSLGYCRQGCQCTGWPASGRWCCRCGCYASLIRYSDPLLVHANVRRAVETGFRSLKLHEIELPAIRAAREKAGPDVGLTLDVNCAWTLGLLAALGGHPKPVIDGHRPPMAGFQMSTEDVFCINDKPLVR
jgi:hypothetical protein